MIDWLTLKVLVYSPEHISDGYIVSYDSDGVLDYSIAKSKSIEGSYSNKIVVRTLDCRGIFASQDYKILHIQGNPAKFFQGHNVLGSSDIVSLGIDFVRSVLRLLGILSSQPSHILDSIDRADFDVLRVDINNMYRLGSRQDVLNVLHAIEATSRSRCGTALTKGSSVYHQKHSRRWSFKFYHKGDELLKRPIPEDIPNREKLIEIANNTLRCELTLRSLELKRQDLKKLYKFKKNTVDNLYKTYLGRIDMTTVKNIDEIQKQIPRKLVSTYLLWKEGYNLRDPKNMATNTFYRHRRQLLEYGIDISIRLKSKDELNNIVDFNLHRLVEIKPVEITPELLNSVYIPELRA